MAIPKTFFITTPIYYPNARLHAGHAYTTLACDALARYKRQCGYEVAFLTGTDEHGEKLERAAHAAGMTPQAFVAEKRREIQDLWKLLEIENTHFIYTDRPDHTAAVHRLLHLARERDPNVIYKARYEGRYCIYDERYLSEGTEPATCDICGRPGELISEDNYFFRLSQFGPSEPGREDGPLFDFYRANPNFVTPDFRFNEVKSFVKSGLRDISISRRRIKWGIPWPDDPEHVFYVWYDALTSYMTGIGYGKAEGGDETFRKFWPADVHMIGKDIIRFHAVYWPAFLMAAGEPLPKQIVAHGWLLVGQDKMSKSKGNAVYVEPVAKFFKSETNGVVSGSDVLRYYVLREFIFGQDGSVSYERMLERYNSDLANGLGNLTNRTLTMISRDLNGRIPSASGPLGDDSILEIDRTAEVAAEAARSLLELLDRFAALDFSRALDAIWHLIGHVNKYLVETSPWGKTITRNMNPATGAWEDADDKAARDRSTILYTSAEALRFIAVLAYPIIPFAAERIWNQLGCEGNLKDQNPADLKWGGLKPGSRIGKPEIIFPRLDVAKSIERLLAPETGEKSEKKGTIVETQPEQKPEAGGAASSAPSPEPRAPSPAVPPASDRISIEDFAKVEMRVGEVVAAERIPKADKLLKLQVDIGTEVRQVLAGIAEYYEPEKLVGMKVVVVTNLQPRKMRGLESNGMIVAAAVGEEGKPVLVTFKEDVPKGSRLR
jgi:methionyl-tRNA synthetase